MDVNSPAISATFSDDPCPELLPTSEPARSTELFGRWLQVLLQGQVLSLGRSRLSPHRQSDAGLCICFSYSEMLFLSSF